MDYFSQYPRLKGSVMVITYGRSGSTLLQTAMNELDDVCVRGENYLAAAPLYESWRRVTAAQADQGANYSKPGQPWFGADQFDAEQFGKDLVATFIHNILRPEHDTQWIGFKEIRYNNMGGSFEGFLDFAFRFFPNLRIIFNLRNWDSVCSSGWFAKKDPQEVRAMLAKIEERFASAAARYPERSLTVKYDNLINDAEEYRKVADFLNVPFNKEKMVKVLAKKLSH